MNELCDEELTAWLGTAEYEVLSHGTDGRAIVIHPESGSRLIRVWHRKPIAEVQYEARLLRFLRSVDYPCPEAYEVVGVLPSGSVVAARPLIEEMRGDGHSPSMGDIGWLLGRLHRVAPVGCVPSPASRFELDNQCFLIDVMRHYEALTDGVSRLNAALDAVDYTRLRRSVVHDDVSRENLLRDLTGNLVLIDWSESHEDYTVADIGAAVAQLDPDGVERELLIEGYRRAQHLSDYEVSLIDLVATRRHAFLVWYYTNLKSRQSPGVSFSHAHLLESALEKLVRGLEHLDSQRVVGVCGG